MTEPYEVEPLAAPPNVTVRVPGSRSFTNRALVAAALADGTSRIEGALTADDTEAMADNLARLRIPVVADPEAETIEVEGTPSRGVLRALREGVELDDGRTTPASASVVGDGQLRLTIHEGRNRQVRRMCEAVGHPVRRLVRTRIGPIADRSLAPATWRPLTPEEVRALYQGSGESRGDQ